MKKDYIRKIVDINNSLKSKIFNIFMQMLILLSIVSFSIETIPDLNIETINYLYYFEVFTIIVFTIEYFLRIYTAKKKFSYIFSFYGLVDLLAILPFYLAFFVDFRAVKAFRLFRLFALLKLVKYNRTLDKFQKAMKNAKEEFIVFFILTLIMFYLASIGIYYFEHSAQPEVFRSIFESMWWAVASLTTVGYGDIYPITIGGKIFTTIILLIGLGIVGIPAGIVASALSEVNKKEREEKKANKKEEID
jgi:voltage-gated potassium channel